MKGYIRRYVTLILSICVLMSSVPCAFATETDAFVDMPGEKHWSYDALTSAVENGILRGNGNRLNPQAPVTRAQMAAMINRVFGAEETADISSFKDIKPTDWCYEDMAKAVVMKTFQGNGTNLYPFRNLTRQEAMTVLARALKLETADVSVLEAYSDKSQISDYAMSSVAAMLQAGYVSGYSDNTIQPQANISREQLAQILYRIFSTYITTTGTYSGDEKGNTIINVPGVTLKDATIAGDLVIGDGVGDGTIILDNVTVEGRLLVRGGGENSIRIINNSNIGSVLVSKSSSGALRILSSEGARVDMIYVDDGKDALILEGTFKNVAVENSNEIILRDANVTALTIDAKKADVTVESGNISTTVISEIAQEAALTVGSDAKLGSVSIEAEATADISGSVAHLIVNDTAESVADVKLNDGAKVTTVTVAADASVKINAAETAKVGNISAADKNNVEISSDSSKKAEELENKVSSGSSTPSTGSVGGGSSSGGGSTTPTTPVTPPAEVVGTEVSSFDQLKAANDNEAVESIVIVADVKIEDDFQTGKNVTIKNGATLFVTNYAIFDGDLVNSGVLYVSQGGRLHIGHHGSFTNQGTADNRGTWFVYGSVVNKNQYVDSNIGSINAFSGASLSGMPDTTVYAVYGDRYYADGSVKEHVAGDITVDETVTLRTSGVELRALTYGQSGYDNAVASGKEYSGLYLVADAKNNAIQLSADQYAEWGTTINDGVRAVIRNGTTLRTHNMDVYGMLEIYAGGKLESSATVINGHGTLSNEGTFESEYTRLEAYSTATGMDGVKLYIAGSHIDTYYADGTVVNGADTVMITGNADVSESDYYIAYVYGAEGLRCALESEKAYKQIRICHDAENLENNTVLITEDMFVQYLLIEPGVTVQIEEGCSVGMGENISYANLYVYGTVVSYGTYAGNLTIQEGGQFVNHGVISLKRSNSLNIYGGTFDNRGTMIVPENTLYDVGTEGSLLNIPADITVTSICMDYYEEGNVSKDTPNSLIVTGGAAVVAEKHAYIYGEGGLQHYLDSNETYDYISLDFFDGQEITLNQSLKVDDFYVGENVNICIPAEVSLTVTDYLTARGNVTIENSGYLTASRLSVNEGAEVRNDGTISCDRLSIIGYAYTGFVKDPTLPETEFINNGSLVVDGSINVSGPKTTLTQNADAYFACYGVITLGEGACLVVKSSVHETVPTDTGFYCTKYVRLNSEFYGDVALISKVISENEIETVVGDCYVNTEVALRTALAAGAENVTVSGDVILTANLILAEHQHVQFEELTVPEGIQLTAFDIYGQTLNVDGGHVIISEGGYIFSEELNVNEKGKFTLESGAHLQVDVINNNGTIQNGGIISITAVFDYGEDLDLSWISSVPGIVSNLVTVNVYLLPDLIEVANDSVDYHSIHFYGNQTVEFTENISLGDKTIGFWAPASIAEGIKLTAGDLTFHDLHLYGEVDAEWLSIENSLITESGSLIDVEQSLSCWGDAVIGGTIDLGKTATGVFRGETYWEETMDVVWSGSQISIGDVVIGQGAKISIYDTCHQLNDLVIPDGCILQLSGNAYYEVLGTLVNHGSFKGRSDVSAIHINNDAIFDNYNELFNFGMLKVQAGGVLINRAAGIISNEGTLQVNEGGVFQNGGTIGGDGTVKGTISELPEDESGETGAPSQTKEEAVPNDAGESPDPTETSESEGS